MATVVLVGTLDTKGEEYRFVADRVRSAGCEVVTIDAGVLQDADGDVDFSRADVAAAAGALIGDLVATGDRGAGVATMARGAAALALDLFTSGRLHGIFGMGGSGGTSLASVAMRSLPVGVPKLLVSTMASGDVGTFVGTADVTMMHSVVDVSGLNAVSRRVLGNAAAAIAGMALAYERGADETTGKPLIGATMYGTTTPCVDRCRTILEDAGFEVLVFHATGTGGRAMEALMRQGVITGAIDVTTTEITDELCGGILSAGPHRLEAAGALGLPQVVSLGAIEQITFTPPEAVPASMAGRTQYAHNQAITLVRATAEESFDIGRTLAAKLNAASGPVSLFVPLRGTSAYSVEGGVFFDPDADAALLSGLREHLDPSVDVVELDTEINARAFAEAMATRLIADYETWARS